jgi:hypothetical protein
MTQRAKSLWRPIETVPKNGHAILACFDGEEWDGKLAVGVIYWDLDNETWAAADGAPITAAPTHWQPIPGGVPTWLGWRSL